MKSPTGNSVAATIAVGGAAFAALVLAAVPVLDLLLTRLFWSGLPESGTLTEHALVALAFLAAAAASASGRHLSLGSVREGEGPWLRLAASLRSGFTTAVDTALLIASLSLLLIGFEPGDTTFGIPTAVFAAPMALGLVLMLVLDLGGDRTRFRAASIGGMLAGVFLSAGALLNAMTAFGLYPEALASVAGAASAVAGALIWPLVIVLVVLAFFGLPLYTVLSGVALLLYLASYSSIELIPSEAYNLFMNDSMPAIPLFTLAGFILSESDAGKRLVAVFREWFGWLPGGEAFAAILVSAFFTTFTGANGVAILALGGILATVLAGTGAYDEDFSHGFITASASIGLLFPPSMAMILYAINATFVVQGEMAFSINDMFLGGLLPGALFVVVMSLMAAARAVKTGRTAAAGQAPGTSAGIVRKFDLKAAGKASKAALPEIAIPFIVLFMYLSGFAGLTEIAAVILVYVVVVEGPIRHDLDTTGVRKAVLAALPVAGGALIIIAAARGLSFYTLQAGLPELFTAWMTSVVSSRTVFLLMLNLALLLVGCFMDIFSAVLIISPLVIPLGAAYGVHPVHLGVIFIANLSIGFLTPPIGMNLFLAGYAFGKPVMRIFRDVLPFFLVQLLVLILITWVPALTLALVGGH